MAINGMELIGKDVITSDGRNVGEVTDVAIDPAKWAVRDLRVSIDKRIAQELGFARGRGAGQFHIKTASIKSVGDLIMLNQSMKMLAELAEAAKRQGDAEPFD